MGFPIQVWQQAVVNGLALGWLYILMALGLTWILSIMGILQLAHGEIYMVGAYLVFYFSRYFGLNLYLSIFLSMVVMAAAGILLERFLFRARPGQDPVMAPIIISTGLTLILTSGAVVSFGLYDRSVPRLINGSFAMFGGGVPKDRLLAMAFSVATILLLYLFLKRTRWGQAILASSQNREGALLRGIDPNQMSMISMAIGCSLGSSGRRPGWIDTYAVSLYGRAAIGERTGHHRPRGSRQLARRHHRRYNPRSYGRHHPGDLRVCRRRGGTPGHRYPHTPHKT